MNDTDTDTDNETGNDTRSTAMTTFTTPGPIAATVQVAGALVRVGASDRTDTVVRVAPVNTASKRDMKVAEKTKVEFADGRLTVKTTTSGGRSGSVAISIDLPAGSSLVADVAHSSVQAVGPLGECELSMGSGRIRLDRVGALRANAAGGEIEVGHIAGRATVEAGSADVRIGTASADLDLSNGSGGFDIDRADGSVTARTGDGAIRIGRLTRGRAELLNRSGNIEIGIGEGSAAWVNARSDKGAVRNSVPAQEHADDNEVTVHARTRYGNVIVERAAN
ncbi:DUF4097 family beta strand repeat-containing protein [Jiangella endophytica]|uniref:DUF4097 family beta strand repeat-containing protein n=1 Tax=Jiangella endophytica TaxID=1623398 RepID=UPI001E5A297D|nr:DUF4097 family beta strand repeat-containing protein [Jiangella endophytica]